MRRIVLAVIAGMIVVSEASNATAVWVDSAVSYIDRGRCRNEAWPWPYICPDRCAAREPFELMIRNGWRRQNLLGSHHFNQATNRLTTAGELHVRWIMTQAPEARRQVYIERALDPSVTSERVAAVREYAGQVAIDGQEPQVFETYMMAEGRPAATVDITNVRFMENMPLPVLPASQYSE